ncbi:MAG TPA: hypothetical protein VF017_24280 [Thermoanaerobaculia bacterium]|nr:hypothetical protein [Thermoanaerobaculia bacterium]
MSDRPKSTPIVREEAAPFREVFLLSFFSNPMDLLKIREAGELFYQMAAEWSRFHSPPGAWKVVMLRAFAADVDYSARFLRGTLAEAGTDSSTTWERVVAVEAERWAARLAAIAADMEAFLAPAGMPS